MYVLVSLYQISSQSFDASWSYPGLKKCCSNTDYEYSFRDISQVCHPTGPKFLENVSKRVFKNYAKFSLNPVSDTGVIFLRIFHL